MRKQANEMLRKVSCGPITLKSNRHNLEQRSQTPTPKCKNRSLRPFLLFLLAAALPISVTAQQKYPPDGPGIPPVALTGSARIQEPPPNPVDQQSQWNMELAGYSDLQGRSAYQPIIINQNGREIAYIGHHTGTGM